MWFTLTFRGDKPDPWSILYSSIFSFWFSRLDVCRVAYYAACTWAFVPSLDRYFNRCCRYLARSDRDPWRGCLPFLFCGVRSRPQLVSTHRCRSALGGRTGDVASARPAFRLSPSGLSTRHLLRAPARGGRSFRTPLDASGK